MQYVSQNVQDTQSIAATLAHSVRDRMPGAGATVIALRGDLGAGKTTFTQGFAHALGIVQRPKSPTFLLAKQYAVPGTPFSMWHLDCYRLKNHADLATIDLHSIFHDPNNIILVEWPENVGDGLPRDRIEVHFEHAGNDKRSITISGI
jgi:tRNA threonylcarbamoyladenosine biosynthesis protein TsaE